MKNKSYYLILVIIGSIIVLSSCGNDKKEDEPAVRVNWDTANLNEEKTYVGYLFEAEKVIDEDGTEKYTPSQYKGYQINNNGTLTVYSGFATQRTYEYTFSNGTFRYKRDTYGGYVDDIELEFSHLNEFRLKLNVKEVSAQGNIFNLTYKVWPKEVL